MEGDEPITADETLYRLVPRGMYDGSRPQIPLLAFAPKKCDTSGISVFRAKYISREAASRKLGGKFYYIAELIASDLFSAGIGVSPAPNIPSGRESAHAELPQLTYAVVDRPETIARMTRLSELATPHGPFPGGGAPPSP